jgi:hypothetical protein
MEEELITLETAKLAEKKNFDEVTLSFYRDNGKADFSIASDRPNSRLARNNFSAPTQSLLQKWVRDVHNIHCSSECNASGWMWVIEKTNGTFIKDSEFSGDIPESGMWGTYEEALEKGLQEALKLIK